ncbi:hypothetical protein FSC37_05435 [Piscinibacter aquaticus]|uniref:Uncharacterized protein n=1 Tax=Piscinibacter aquaticus TaxID=392597 RepID=A0A5C6U1Q5_9BURK|nr:hypothetical protein FSC37_05435 [Piscinibacter aquaticus]
MAASDGASVWPMATGVMPSASHSVPPAGSAVTVTPTMRPSTSVPVRLIDSAASSSPEPVPGVATGASLTALSVMAVLPVLLRPSDVVSV